MAEGKWRSHTVLCLLTQGPTLGCVCTLHSHGKRRDSSLNPALHASGTTRHFCQQYNEWATIIWSFVLWFLVLKKRRPLFDQHHAQITILFVFFCTTLMFQPIQIRACNLIPPAGFRILVCGRKLVHSAATRNSCSEWFVIITHYIERNGFWIKLYMYISRWMFLRSHNAQAVPSKTRYWREEGKTEGTRGRLRRRKQLLNDLKGKRRYQTH